MNSSSIEIKHTWTIIGTGKASVLELRAIWPPAVLSSKSPITKHFRATEYLSIEACKEAFESEALRLNGLGYNIYIVMNPIKPTFVGGAAVILPFYRGFKSRDFMQPWLGAALV